MEIVARGLAAGVFEFEVTGLELGGEADDERKDGCGRLCRKNP